MKFIILHVVVSGNETPFYVSVDKITHIWKNPFHTETNVEFGGYEHNYVSVEESPEQIMQMIKDVTE